MRRAMVLIFLLLTTGCDQRQEERPSAQAPPRSTAANEKPSVDEKAIEQDLRTRAYSAADYLMDNMKQVEDFKNTLCMVRKLEVVRQPNNVTIPYVGHVILSISDRRLDYDGRLNLDFEYQSHGWYLAEVRPSDYVAGPSGQDAPLGKIATTDAIPWLRDTQTQWVYLWKVAYAEARSKGQDRPTVRK